MVEAVGWILWNSVDRMPLRCSKWNDVMAHDLKGLIQFSKREPWRECLMEIAEAHFGLALDTVGLEELSDLDSIIGEAAVNNLWGCAFEDMLTRDFDVKGVNIVDDYLKRRGWKENARVKAYMIALRTSVMSLYEVGNIVPGVSLMARDLLRGGEPVLVHEKTGTTMLTDKQRIGARIVFVHGKNILAGGLLPMTEEAAELILEGFRTDFGQRKSKKMPEITNAKLQETAPIFSTAWLSHEVKYSMASANIVREAAKNLITYQAVFPLAAGVTQKTIAPLLDEQDDTDRIRSKVWLWFEDEPMQRDELEEEDMMSELFGDDEPQRTLIRMDGRTLTFETISETNAAKGEERLRTLLGQLVGEPQRTTQTFDQVLEMIFGEKE